MAGIFHTENMHISITLIYNLVLQEAHHYELTID